MTNLEERRKEIEEIIWITANESNGTEWMVDQLLSLISKIEKEARKEGRQSVLDLWERESKGESDPKEKERE